MAHWMTFFRGLFAVALGIALIFRPDAARPLLGNFMGVFWFTSGLISIRWGLTSKHAKGITIIIGVLGALAGLLMLARNLVINWIDFNLLMSVLGVIIVLTGFLHVSGRMPVRHGPVRWTRSGLFLGIFEIALGLVMIFADTIGPFLNVMILIWAFLGGFVLIYDAWQIREETRQSLAVNEEDKGENDENI